MSDLFPDRIETERLALEPLTTERVDVLELYEHVRVGAPHVDEVTEYLTWSPHETPKETREFVETVTEKRENDEGATYVIRPKDGDSGAGDSGAGESGAGEIAGVTGIGVDWDAQTATLGTWLRKRFWGRGYSGERAGALIEMAFERLDLQAVVVTVHEDNEKSMTAVSRYVEAHGGRREGLLRNYHADQDGTPVDVYRYTVTRAEYEDATGE